MFEEPFLRAARKADSTYDFNKAFEGLREICAESDIVVGNLETPLAGEDKGYTNEMYSFNTPDSCVSAIKNMGVTCVLTANNHCCDRGIEGLKRTLEVLDRHTISHTGSFDGEENNTPYIIELEGVKIAIISCTASTNASRTKCSVTADHVNLMQMQLTAPADRSLIASIKGFLKNRMIGEKNFIKMRIKAGLSPKKMSTDNILNVKAVQPYIDRISDQIEMAKGEADVVFVCPHMGGQFNVIPGAFSEYAMKSIANAGVDAIVGSHPHIVQKAELKGTVPCIFSIGNVSMSMSTLYILRDELPDYGVMMHFYLKNGKMDEVTYSLIVMDEIKDGYVIVKTAYDMVCSSSLEKKEKIIANAERVVRRLTRDEDVCLDKIEKEFVLFGANRMRNRS